MEYVFTAKAETDGVGVAGEIVPANADLAYLKLHGYVVESAGLERGDVASPPATTHLKQRGGK